MQIEYRDRTQLCRCLEKKVLVDRMIQISRSFATFKGSSIQKYIDKSEPPRASIIYLPHLPATRAVSGVLYKKITHINSLNCIGLIDSFTCWLCNTQPSPLSLSMYPRRAIWSVVLGTYFTTFGFSDSLMLNLLHSLQNPFHHKSSFHYPLFLVTAIAQYYN